MCGKGRCQWRNGKTYYTITLRGEEICTMNGGGDWRNSGDKLLIPYSKPLFDHRFKDGIKN